MRLFKLLIAGLWIAFTCDAASTNTDGDILPQRLVADHEKISKAFYDVRKLATDISSWSTEAYRAVSKHIYYDPSQKGIVHNPDSEIDFLRLSHGQTVDDALIFVMKEIEVIKLQARMVTLYANAARLKPDQLFRAECYCEKFKTGWFSPPDAIVDWLIDLARTQISGFRGAVSWADIILSPGVRLETALSRLDAMIALEDSFQNKNGPAANYRLSTQRSEGGRAALEQVKMLRKQIGRSLDRDFNKGNFESVRKIIETRSRNLTMLLGMEKSFNRASASIDLACAMAQIDVHASAMHMIAHGSAKMGFCAIAG